MDADHSGVENLGFIEMLAQVVEDGLAEDFVEGFFACLDAVENFGPSLELLVARHEGECPLGVGDAGLQRFGEWCERELARRAFGGGGHRGGWGEEEIRGGVGGERLFG